MMPLLYNQRGISRKNQNYNTNNGVADKINGGEGVYCQALIGSFDIFVAGNSHYQYPFPTFALSIYAAV